MEVLNWYMDDAKSGGGRNKAKVFTKEQIEKMGKSWSQSQCWSEIKANIKYPVRIGVVFWTEIKSFKYI